jgi:YgiT-type zinc finger domain-containing protein
MKPDKCSLCGGVLRKGKTELVIRVGEEIVVIKDIPAYVCENCGEPYFTPETSRRIDKIMEDFYGDRVSKKLIRVFEISY